jgi:hypothetical protein
MIHLVADVLRDYVATIHWIETSAGIAVPIKKKLSGVEKVSPGYLVNGSYIDLSPNNKSKGIAFWHTGESVVISETAQKVNERVDMDLVCWYNLKSIDIAANNSSWLAMEVHDAIPRSFRNDNGIIAAKINYQGISQDYNIWSGYGFDDANNQFLTYPYGFFVLRYEILYWYSRNCVTTTKTPGVC